MQFVITSAAKDLRRRLADFAGLAIWLGIPLFVGLLMVVIFGGGNATPKASVLLADEDQSLVGRFLAGAASGEGANYLDLTKVSAEEGRARLDRGEGSALVVLPKGLTDAIFNDTPASITLVTNPAQRVMPEVVRTGLEMFVEAVFYLQQILGEPLRAFRKTPQDDKGFRGDSVVGAFSGNLNRRLRALQPILMPPVLTLETPAEPSATGGADIWKLLLVPTMLFMTVLFVARGFSDDLWEERERGTLRRAVVTPSGAASFMGGKLAAGVVFMAVISLVALLVLVPMTATPWLRLPAALVWCTFSGVTLICLFTMLQFLASTARGANIVTTMVMFPMMMIGGSFFPLELMPRWMAAIGRLTPNGQGVVQLRAILGGTVDAAGLALAVLAMGLPSVAFFFLSVRLVRSRFAAGV